jgi:hypothetical protein
MRYHDDGCLRRQAIIDRAEHERLRAAARFPGAGDALRVHVR